MTQIEKAVRDVSDLCDFYRRIPKIGGAVARRQTAPDRHELWPLALREDEQPGPAGHRPRKPAKEAR